jgi:uncharacterized membrane protein
LFDWIAAHADLLAFGWFCAPIPQYLRVGAGARSIVGQRKGRTTHRREATIGRRRGCRAQPGRLLRPTSAIAIGGLTAIMGSGEKVQTMLERLPYVAKSSPELWELKTLLLIGIFVYAFFKFAWAFRLSHYTGIMIGATPLQQPGNEATCDAHATRTASLIGIAAEHANGGLRSYYYAIAAMAWYFHPLAFAAAATWVLVTLMRRDFFSRSRRIIAG